MKKLWPIFFLIGCGLHPKVFLPPEENKQGFFTTLSDSIGRKYGYDVMALATYCDIYLQAPRLPYASTLLNTFGDPIPCLDRAVSVMGLTDVQIDLVDATCHRNHVCPPGTPPPGDRKTIRDRARNVAAFAQRHPELVVWISPALEYDIKDAGILRGMFAAAREGCPICRLIQSPNYHSGLILPEFKLELHGNTNQAFAVSNDGSSLFDSDSGAYRLHGSNYVADWFPELNDRFSGEKTFTPPKLRKCRPTLALFVQAYLVLKPPEPPADFPRSCQVRRDVKAPEISKVNSESYCSTDPRGNRPLYISKITGRPGDRLNVVSVQDRSLGFFRYYGPYTTKGFYRWYLGTGSGQNPVELFRQAGGEWAFIKRRNAGRIECIRFNTIRRLGTFR